MYPVRKCCRSKGRQYCSTCQAKCFHLNIDATTKYVLNFQDPHVIDSTHSRVRVISVWVPHRHNRWLLPVTLTVDGDMSHVTMSPENMTPLWKRHWAVGNFLLVSTPLRCFDLYMCAYWNHCRYRGHNNWLFSHQVFLVFSTNYLQIASSLGRHGWGSKLTITLGGGGF